MREKLIEMAEHLQYCATDSDCTKCKRWDEVSENDCVDDLLAKAAELRKIAANGVTIAKWIPVTERLPEKWQHVLAASKCGDAYSIDFDHICSTGEWYGNLETEYKVTHWMPLPEPPKGE